MTAALFGATLVLAVPGANAQDDTPAASDEAPAATGDAPAAVKAQPASDAVVSAYTEYLPKVMLGRLLERDCPSMLKDEHKELSWYIEHFIRFAEIHPQLKAGLTNVYDAQKAYDAERGRTGFMFCNKRADDIMQASLKNARSLAKVAGVDAYNARDVDVAGVEKTLLKAAKSLGQFPRCTEIKRDTDLGVTGRIGSVMFFHGVVADLQTGYAEVKDFMAAHGADEGFADKLEKTRLDASQGKHLLCSLKHYIDLSGEVSDVVRRYGLAEQKLQ